MIIDFCFGFGIDDTTSRPFSKTLDQDLVALCSIVSNDLETYPKL